MRGMPAAAAELGMKKRTNRMKQALGIVWCAGLLLLGGWSNAEEGTWRQEYEGCLSAMERGMTEGQELSDFVDEEKRDKAVQRWQDSLSAFEEWVEACVRSQPGGMDGEEDIYRVGTLFMAAMCEERGGSYEFVYAHGGDMEKAQEAFRAVIEGENPIDENINAFRRDFGIYYYADALISERMEEAWQEEFYHCLDMAEKEVKQSAADKGQPLEALEAWRAFIEVWADNEDTYRWLAYNDHIICINAEEKYERMKEKYEWMRPGGGGLHIWRVEGRAEIFRTGTLLLIDGLEKSGGSYAFIYDGEAGRQELIELLGVCPETDDGTWRQEYEICMASMERRISEYISSSPDIPYENLQGYDKRETDGAREAWGNSLRAISEFVDTCVRNQSGGTEGEEEIYRTAVLLMTAMGNKWRVCPYLFAHEHGEDMEKALEDFRAVIEGENPIDESWDSFARDFDRCIKIDFTLYPMMADAWQREFENCLNVVRDRVRQSDTGDQQQLLEILEALEDFLEIWAENEGNFHRAQEGTGANIFIAEDRAKVYRTGTMLLTDVLERAGGSYEFIYDSEPDRQALIHDFAIPEALNDVKFIGRIIADEMWRFD